MEPNTKDIHEGLITFVKSVNEANKGLNIESVRIDHASAFDPFADRILIIKQGFPHNKTRTYNIPVIENAYDMKDFMEEIVHSLKQRKPIKNASNRAIQRVGPQRIKPI